MPDAVDLALVAGSALPATFTFLYEQLGTVLQRWRSGRTTEPQADVQLPAELVGQIQLPLQADPARVQEHWAKLQAYALGLAHYQRNPGQIDSRDRELMQLLGQLRADLEDIYGQRFTFQGEPRPASGPMSVLELKEVRDSRVVGMRADSISGNATSRIKADTVGPGSQIIGMIARDIGGSNS